MDAVLPPSIPLIDIDERRGVARFDGKRLRLLRPGYRVWAAFMALARANGAPVERDELSRALRLNPVRQDKEEVVRDVIRRTREALKETGADTKVLVETLGLGCWRLNARVTIDTDSEDR